MQQIFNGNKGVSIIEILVIAVIIAIVFVSLLSLAVFSLRISTLIKETTQANFLAQEAIEGVRNFRDKTVWQDNGLGSLDFETSYYLEKDFLSFPAELNLVQGEELIGQFSREIIFSNVQRDGNRNIVESGGINDPETKKITIFISWKNRQMETSTYLTKWK